jgi:serine/threonine-protein kinase
MGNAGAPSYAGYFEEITSLSGFGAVAAGDDHYCAIRSGSVYCWGDNEVGQCGQPKTTDVEVPTQVPGLSSVTDIALGAFFSCALSGGQVYCWGSNSYGQAGDDSDPDFDDPRLIRNPSDTGNLSGVTALSAGGEHACAQVGSSGPVYCWGYNANAQLGVGYFDTTHYLPEDLSPLNN